MKNKLFRKAAAVAVGSLMIFSGQALAFSSRNQEVTNTGAMDNNEVLTARHFYSTRREREKPVKRERQVVLAESVSVALNTVGDALSQAVASSMGAEDKIAISQSLAQAVTLLGTANARANSFSLTTDDAKAIAVSISEAKVFIGNAKSKAESTAIGGEAIARAIATAESTAGTAEAEAVAVAVSN